MLGLAEIASILGTGGGPGCEGSTTGASVDSRTLEPGMVFFALRGTVHDGNDFIADAFRRGASAAVAERSHMALVESGVVFKVDDVLEALARIATAFRKRLGIPIIGVTGSNGKTTTKEMIAQVLASRYRVEKSAGNLNNHIGVPLTVLNWKKKADIGVLEMGTNHFGEIRHLSRMVEPTHGVITNIGKGHLEFFKDRNGVLKAKKEILEELPDEGTAFLNGDDDLLQNLRHLRRNTVLFGFSPGCSFRASDLTLNESGHASFRIGSEVIRLRAPGRHQAMNALAACAVAVHFHVPLSTAGECLNRFTPAARRMEMMKLGDMVVLNDTYNANPSSMLEALSTLMSIHTAGRKIAVLGDMLELGEFWEKEHERLGETAAGMGLDLLFGFGRGMKKAVDGARLRGMKSAVHFGSREAMVTELARTVRSGDVLLFKGSRGMAMETVIEGLKELYDNV